MEATIELKPGGYRLEVEQDECACHDNPMCWNATVDEDGWSKGSVQYHTLEASRCMNTYHAEDLRETCYKALEADRALRKACVDQYELSKQLQEWRELGHEDVAENILEAMLDYYESEENQQAFYVDCLESACKKGLIADYAIEEQSYDRSAWATLACIVFEKGYGEAQGYLDQYAEWARGEVYCVSLMCDMVDAEGEVKYSEMVDSLCGVYGSGLDDLADYLDAPEGVDLSSLSP